MVQPPKFNPSGTLPKGNRTTEVALIGLSLLGLALTGAAIGRELRSVHARPEAPAIGRIETVVREAKRRANASLVWENIEPNDPVWSGDGIFVGDGALASVRLADGSSLTVEPNTLIVVEQAAVQASPGMSVSLHSGSVIGRAGEKGLNVSVGEARAHIGAAGAAQVAATTPGTGQVVVLEGLAELRLDQGTPVEVATQQASVMSPSGVTNPVNLGVLLQKPAAGAAVYLSGLDTTVGFSWTGATDVIFELASDRSFGSLVHRQQVRGAQYSVSHLLPGSYFWRVRVPGAQGGLSEERALVLAQESAPVPLQPVRGQVLFLPGQTTAAFLWSVIPGATRYRLEIATDEACTQTVVAREVERPQWTTNAFAGEGTYYWRVRAVSPDGASRPWSAAIPFRLVLAPLPQAPELYEPEIVPKPAQHGSWLLTALMSTAHADEPGPTPTGVLLRWQLILEAVKYTLQVADDPDFAHVVLNVTVIDTFYRWTVPERRQYWWRVRSIDSDSRRGDFSLAKVIEVEDIVLPALPATPAPPAAAPTPPVRRTQEREKPAPQAPTPARESTSNAKSEPALQKTFIWTTTWAPHGPFWDVSLGYATNFSAVSSPTINLGIGTILTRGTTPILAVMRVGYHFAQERLAGPVRVTATEHVVPIAIGLRAGVPLGLVTPYLGASVLLGTFYGRLSAAGQPSTWELTAEPGAEVVCGAAVAVGRGELLLELRYAGLSHHDSTFALDGGGMAAVLGYRMNM